MKQKKSLAKVTIAPEHAGIEVASFIKQVLGISNRQAQKVVRTKGLILNGRPIHSKTKLKVGDQLEVLLPQKEQVKIPVASSRDLIILHEDAWFLAVEKPAGLPTYDLRGKEGLANQVAGYFQKQGFKITPRPLHRLDTPTSGVIVFAKDATTQRKMSKLWQENKVERFYWALCQGELTSPLEIDTPIGKQKAYTKVKPLQIHHHFTELSIQLFTGRTHQIRQHLAEAGYPLLGDRRYGRNKEKSTRLALHAKCVRFPHPYLDGKILEINSPIPSELQVN